MILWVDDVRPAPKTHYTNFKTYIPVRSVNEAKSLITDITRLGFGNIIEYIDIDHDAGEYAKYGGDYIELLNWLEETGRNYPIHIHSMNPVGVENMRRIIQRNGWKEID